MATGRIIQSNRDRGAKIQLSIFSGKVKRQVALLMSARVDQAAKELKAQIKANISEDGSGYHSRPMHYPFRQTKALYNSIEISKKAGPTKRSRQIFSDLEYAPYLELGTSKIIARPFFSATMQQMASRIRKILTCKIGPLETTGRINVGE